ncbi:MAG: protein BatD [Candidatus Eisenbacteria sp.]|nr:protein BatD [Candidatus Eisenbacteria bacterium]
MKRHQPQATSKPQQGLGGKFRLEQMRAPAALLMFLFLVSAAGIAAPAGAGEPRIRTEINRSQVSVGEVVVLEVSLENFSRRAKAPQVPKTEGLEIYDAGHSTNISWVNGKFSSSIIYTYKIAARKEGTYSLGPITVEDKGRLYRGEPVTLRITAAGGQAPASRQGGTRQSDHSTSGAPATALFARIELDKTQAYLDEQIVLRFLLYQRTDIRLYEITGFEPPTTEGFWREDLGPQRDYRVEIDGNYYDVREIAWALFPTKAGELEIGPGRIVCHVPDRSRRRGGGSVFFGGSIFGRRQIPLTTEARRIQVKPLPQHDRPEGFTGTVGEYEIDARFDAPEAKQGEPLALIVSVRGSGHVQTIAEPEWPQWEGLRVYDSGEAVSVEKKDGRVVGEKTFTQVLIPTRSGPLSLDPVCLTFFNPRQERYAAICSGPLQIDVHPLIMSPGGSGAEGIVALGDDILYIRTDLLEGLKPSRPDQLSWFWLVHLLPLGIVAGAAWFRRHRLVLERNPSLARRAGAAKRMRARLARINTGESASRVAGDLSEAFEVYLSDWLDLEVRGLRRADLRNALADAWISAELLQQTLSLLDWADEVRFGAGGAGEIRQRMEISAALVRELESALRGSALGAGL